MKNVICAAAIALSVSAHASDESDKAFRNAKITATTDVVSTLVGISKGIVVEGNPLGVNGMIAGKVLALAIVSDLPEPKKLDFSNKMTTVWGGLTVSNTCLLLGGGPACYIIGVIAGVKFWDNRVRPIEKEI